MSGQSEDIYQALQSKFQCEMSVFGIKILEFFWRRSKWGHLPGRRTWKLTFRELQDSVLLCLLDSLTLALVITVKKSGFVFNCQKIAVCYLGVNDPVVAKEIGLMLVSWKWWISSGPAISKWGHLYGTMLRFATVWDITPSLIWFNESRDGHPYQSKDIYMVSCWEVNEHLFDCGCLLWAVIVLTKLQVLWECFYFRRQ